jgi:uncharacterized phage protein gp47/JayE
MATYPLATLAPTITAAGITAPSYNDILQSLIASFQAIYGSDIVVTPDSQDGQMLAVYAKAIYDQNQVAITVYNSLSPYYSQGAQLSSLVKLSAISRNVATNSTAVGNVSGNVGAQILNGVVKDVNGNLWNLPPVVTIPNAGIIAVTVTAQQVGAIPAQIGDISSIYNPQFGWTSFTNTSSATMGAPVESDAALRRRQLVSSSLPAMSILAAIYAAIGNVLGVTRWFVYENATNGVDANGLLPHSFCAVVEGGTTTAIATAIQSRKPPGIQSFGTTAVPLLDKFNLPVTINYSVLGYVEIFVLATIQSLTGYTAAIGTELITAISNFINSLTIGEGVYYSQVNAAASLISLPDGQTFYIQSLFMGSTGFTGRIDNGTIGIAGNQLTVSAMALGSAPIRFDGSMTVFGIGMTAVTITGQTGGVTGGAGTYTVSGAAQSIAAESMVGATGGGVANIPVAFNNAAQCLAANVQLVVH